MLTSDEQTYDAYQVNGQVREGYVAVSKGVLSKILKCCNACLDKKAGN